jgi:hypothetical protein
VRVVLMAHIDEEEHIEAEVDLPAIPRFGDYVGLTDSSQTFAARVDRVFFSAFQFDRVEVWLSFDGLYDRDEVRSLMEGAREGAQW